MAFRYFEDDEEEEGNAEDLEYQPAPDSPSHAAGEDGAESDESVDPLDAFMAGVEVTHFLSLPLLPSLLSFTPSLCSLFREVDLSCNITYSCFISAAGFSAFCFKQEVKTEATKSDKAKKKKRLVRVHAILSCLIYATYVYCTIYSSVVVI